MTTSRLAILLAVLLLGLSGVFLLPKQIKSQPVGINLELPEIVGEWYGTAQKITEKEQAVLGSETEFSRKSYTNGRGDQLEVTVVLAGQDMNTSIHRPERCLMAQGWQLAGSRPVAVRAPERGALETTCLHIVRMFTPQEGARPKPIYQLSYYWFVGYDDNTGSHVERTWIDIRDRVLRGYNQRWAYFTVGATITEGLTKFGRSEKETDALIQDFIQKLAPLTLKDTVKLH